MKNLTLMSKVRMKDEGAKVRKAIPFKLGLKLATQRCAQAAPGQAGGSQANPALKVRGWWSLRS